MTRSPELQNFLDATREAFGASSAGDAARQVADRIFTAAATIRNAARPAPLEQPACIFLDPALKGARDAGGTTATLADTLFEISPKLAWYRRPSGPDDGATFADRHANAAVVGVNGLEQRNDIRVGISLLAPKTRYPDHRHPPEEIYLVLTPGEWKQGAKGAWRAPGVGGFVHNAPNIVHAMRSNDAPLLAVWCLWVGNAG